MYVCICVYKQIIYIYIYMYNSHTNIIYCNVTTCNMLPVSVPYFKH